jgi:alkyl hydroperoxide reductase subunit F
MLDTDLKQQVKEYFQKLNQDVSIMLYEGDHPSREELKSFLIDLVSLSDKLYFKESPDIATGIYFELYRADGSRTGISFDGIPGGHEFSSLILAILQTGGYSIKLDDSMQSVLARYESPLVFETFVSLDCHNCPEVVQTLNSFALLNPHIKNKMIDGALFPEIIKEKNIQGVPAVYLNGKRFLSGQADTSKIFDKLLETYPQTQIISPEENPKANFIYDVVVIGGGPSGIASAVYTARKGLDVLVIADRIGGQVKDTMGIENIISMHYTTGPELTKTLIQQLESNKVQKKENVRVTHIEPGATKKITLNTGEIILAKTIIVSTGAKWRELGVPGEKENVGKGVAYCPHCDGPFFKGKDVVVVGGGNSGIEAALDLSGIVHSVTVIEYGDQFKADQVLVDKMKSTSNITAFLSAQTKEILSENEKVNGLVFVDRTTQTETKIPTDGVFVQIGLIPNSGFLNGLVETNRFGEILVDEKCRTNVEGIFACGDVTQTPYKQIIIAMGEGAKAAISAFEHLMLAA